MIKEINPVEIKIRSYNALVWNYIGSFISMTSQFSIGIILARLLGPEAFGIVAIGWLMVGIGNLVADFGLSSALIQSNIIVDDDVRFIFTMQVLSGVILTLGGFFSASIIAAFFHHVTAAPIIQAMSFLFLIQSFGQTSSALLRRALNFKDYQKINIISYLIGYLLIGVPSAYCGIGVWSLVAAQLTQASVFSILVIYTIRPMMRPKFNSVSPGIFSFGSKVMVSNLTSWAISNFDSMIIGNSLGIISLGVYNRTMALIATPINTLTVSLQSVLFAASSRAQNDTLQVKKSFFAATTAVGLICFPITFIVASIPETVVLAIYGEKWIAAVPLLTPIALAMALNSLLAIVGPVLMAKNKVGLELRAQLITLLVMIPVIYLAAQQSLELVAWGVVLIFFLRWLLLVQAVLKILNVSWLNFIKILQWPLLLGISLAILIYFVDREIKHTSYLSHLIIDVTVVAIFIVLSIRIFGKKFLHSLDENYSTVTDMFPKIVKRILCL